MGAWTTTEVCLLRGKAGNLVTPHWCPFRESAPPTRASTANMLLFGSAWALQVGYRRRARPVSRGHEGQRRSAAIAGPSASSGPPDMGGPSVIAPEPADLTCGMTVTLPFTRIKQHHRHVENHRSLVIVARNVQRPYPTDSPGSLRGIQAVELHLGWIRT